MKKNKQQELLGKDRRKRLKWFLDFIRTDLASLSEENVFELRSELSAHIFGVSIKDSDFVSIISQRHLMQRMKEGLINDQKKLKRKTEGIFNFIRSQQEIISDPTIDPGVINEEFSISFKLELRTSGGTISCDRYSEEDDYDDNLVICFIESFVQVNPKDLRICPECDNWFFKIHKQEKQYCNPRCASRHIMRKIRKKEKLADTNKHKKTKREGAKRARKSYVRKIRKTNPKVKVERRPTKYKEK